MLFLQKNYRRGLFLSGLINCFRVILFIFRTDFRGEGGHNGVHYYQLGIREMSEN